MKFVVVSDKTIETALIKETILKDMKSDKEKELEKKQEEIKNWNTLYEMTGRRPRVGV